VFGYRINDLQPEGGNEAVRLHPIAKRLAIAGPWQLCKHAEGGSFATWRGAPSAPDAYGEPRACLDGLIYFPPKDASTLTPAALAKSDARADTTVVLSSGLTISIPLAVRGTRRRRFGADKSLGEFTEEFTNTAFAFFDRVTSTEDKPLQSDAQLCRLLYLATASRYRHTEESLDDAGWLTTADDAIIVRAVFGSDPKAGAAGGGTSP
jgi:hypothetical protein